MILFLPALITTKNTNANRCLTFIGAFDCLSACTFKRVHKNPSKIGLSVSKAHWKVMRFNQTMFFFFCFIYCNEDFPFICLEKTDQKCLF